MKTTKRSKMLLSSIAMLLVALVALGSATYAWYTINRTVTASDAQIKAAAPGGLEIKLASDTDWDDNHEVDLDALQDTFLPSSLTFGTTGVATAKAIDAASDSNYAGNTSAALLDVTGDSAYYATQEIVVGNTNSKDQTVTMEIAVSAANTTYSNLAVLKKYDTATDWTLIGTYKSAGTANGAITALSGGSFTTVNNNDNSLKLGAVDSSNPEDTQVYGAGKTCHYLLVAYVDGQNSNCATTTADSTNAADFDITFNTAD